MTDKRKKIKDLAGEMSLQSKDILAAAKELGINSAKVATSSISLDEADKIRKHISTPPQEKPEVIVRRRRPAPQSASDASSVDKTADELPSVPDAAQSQTAALPDGYEQTAHAPVLQAEELEQALVGQAEIEPRPEDSPLEESAETHEKDRQPAEKKPPAAARIITPAQTSAETTPEPVSLEALETQTPEPELEALNQAEEKEPTVLTPAQDTTPLATPPVDTPTTKTERPRINARIIRPASFSAEPERNALGETISSAPLLPLRNESQSRQDEAGGETASSPPAPGVRVISRPKPGQSPKSGDGGSPRGPSRFAPGQRQPREAGAAQSKDSPARQHPGAPQSPAPFNPGQAEGEAGRKKRQKGRRTVEFAHDVQGESDDAAIMRSGSRRKQRSKQRDLSSSGSTQPMRAVKRVIKIEEFIRVSDLAHQMGLKAGEIIKVLFNLGVMATINQSLDVDTATLVAAEYAYEVEKVGFFEEDFLSPQHADADDEELLAVRPPVVTIMGHVDHGKTSLLDALRKTTTASGEAGGITQHIGAYHVKTPKGEIVFLDTPGHEAFTAMRARGAEVTDIVVLVVAADDGVMEQTREAISHAKAAKVPIMVAVNKMDKPEANTDRVKRELAAQGLVPEEWGGGTTFTYVSAKTGQGLDELLELLALQAEILELKANPEKPATGHIIEAKLDKGRGALGTVLITSGTLHQGDVFVCGIHSGRVRAMFNDQGKKVKEAGPAIPVEVQGFEGVPEAGDEFICLGDEKTARRIAESRTLKQRERELAKESKVTLETFLAKRADDVEAIVLNLVVKSDVQGSLEAITDALHKLSTEKIRINIIHGGTGAISESDILLASASNAIIIGFNVRPTVKAKELAENEKIDMRFYDVIYKLVEEIKNAMEGMLAPVSKEVYLGLAEVRETFSVPKAGLIAGCHISDGKFVRSCHARLLRDGVVIYTGKVASLRRFKDDVKEVAKGYECGIGLENYNDIKVGDAIEAYEIVEEAAKL